MGRLGRLLETRVFARGGGGACHEKGRLLWGLGTNHREHSYWNTKAFKHHDLFALNKASRKIIKHTRTQRKKGTGVGERRLAVLLNRPFAKHKKKKKKKRTKTPKKKKKKKKKHRRKREKRWKRRSRRVRPYGVYGTGQKRHNRSGSRARSGETVLGAAARSEGNLGKEVSEGKGPLGKKRKHQKRKR